MGVATQAGAILREEAAAIAELHERLTKYKKAVFSLCVHKLDVSRNVVNWETQRLKEKIQEATQADHDFEAFYAASVIYLPRSLAAEVDHLMEILSMEILLRLL